MRFNIVLEKKKYDKLPKDYQYVLATWIYSRINTENSEFGNWLSEKGYRVQCKRFNLYCFSRLFFTKFHPLGDRIQILSEYIDFQVSIVTEKTAVPYFISLFQNQFVTLGDSKSSVDFQIKSVEALDEPDFASGKSQFIARTPISLSFVHPDENAVTYLSPDHEDYADYIKSNLIHKFNSVFPKHISSDVSFSFKLLNRPNHKLVTVHKGEANETKVSGYLYSFELQTAKELLSFVYSSGLGEKNSMGFGFIDQK